MDSAQLQTQADRILDSHLQGLRETSYTIDNLIALLTTAQKQKSPLLRYLWDQLLSALPKPPVKLASCEPSVIEVVMRTFAQLGEAQKPFMQLFVYFQYDEPILVENWIRQVVPTMISVLYGHRDHFSSDFLSSLKVQCELYLDDRRRRLAGIDYLDERFILAMKQLRNAIEEIEFSEFEKRLKASAKTIREQSSNIKPSNSEAFQQEIPAVIASALSKAEEHLRQKGEFDPKIAGDLLRTSMDEAHRAIIDKLSSPKAPYSGADKDGARRGYLREREFISPAEDQFFSAVYSLISKEGSHRLIAPRETVLLMHQTVTGYIQLLFRRLSSWKSRNAPRSEETTPR